MKSAELLREMREEVLRQKAWIEADWLNWSDQKLSTALDPQSWSALQCLEHLNSYARHYLPEFEKAMNLSRAAGLSGEEEFKSTWLGRYCIQSVLPSSRKKKLKSPVQHNYAGKEADRKVLMEFLDHQRRLLFLLEEAEEVSLNKTRVTIEIMKFLKLRLGDFFPFLIWHQARHLDQGAEAAAMV